MIIHSTSTGSSNNLVQCWQTNFLLFSLRNFRSSVTTFLSERNHYTMALRNDPQTDVCIVKIWNNIFKCPWYPKHNRYMYLILWQNTRWLLSQCFNMEIFIFSHFKITTNMAAIFVRMTKKMTSWVFPALQCHI